MSPQDIRPDPGPLDWERAHRALDAAARTLLDNPHVNDGPDRDEAVRFVTRFLTAASTFELESDPCYPHLERVFSSLGGNWFLPCPDGLYLYAVLDGRFDYRIECTRGTAHMLVAEVFQGGFHDVPNMRVFDSRSDFDIDEHGRFEITLGRDEGPGNRLRIPPGPSLVLLRQWFYDWDTEERGQFVIERVGEMEAALRPADLTLSSRWQRYVDFLDTTAASLIASVATHYGSPADRVPFPPMMKAVSDSDDDDPYSMRGQVYGQGYYRCEPGEAVIMELEPPDCEYWSFALYSHFWEIHDWLFRATSINGRQAVLDDDGRFRAVISHSDPGVLNWLDAGGRTFGLIGGRYYGTRSVPEPTLRTVPLADIRDHLPAGSASVTPADRTESMRRRVRALRRRFSS